MRERHTYVQVDVASVPSGLRWDVPPENQGQIVEVAYADDPPEVHRACSGSRYRRVIDRRDRSVAYWRRARG